MESAKHTADHDARCYVWCRMPVSECVRVCTRTRMCVCGCARAHASSGFMGVVYLHGLGRDGGDAIDEHHPQMCLPAHACGIATLLALARCSGWILLIDSAYGLHFISLAALPRLPPTQYVRWSRGCVLLFPGEGPGRVEPFRTSSHSRARDSPPRATSVTPPIPPV